MKKRFLLKRFGVSLIEAMVVIVIIAVLLLVWKFVSNGHIKIAMINEGRAFVEKVVAQERMYRTQHNSFKEISSPASNDTDIMINTYDNKYFKTFTVTTTSAGIDVIAIGTGKANNMKVTGVYSASNNNLSITENYGT